MFGFREGTVLLMARVPKSHSSTLLAPARSTSPGVSRAHGLPLPPADFRQCFGLALSLGGPKDPFVSHSPKSCVHGFTVAMDPILVPESGTLKSRLGWLRLLHRNCRHGQARPILCFLNHQVIPQHLFCHPPP